MTGSGPCVAIITEGFVDDSELTILAWTTTPSDYIMITTNGSARHDGVWNNSKYVLEAVGSDAIGVRTNNVIIDGLQILATQNDSDGRGIELETNNPINVTIRNNIIVSGENANGIVVLSVGGDTLIYNNIIYNTGTQGTMDEGIICGTGSVDIFNNVISNFNDGIELDGACDMSVRNTVVFGNGDDFDGVLDINFSASVDGDGGSFVLINTSRDFVNASAYDFRLKPGSLLIDAGTSVSGFSGDIVGATRPVGSAWDIGAFEWNGNKGVIPEDSGQPFFVNSTYQNNPVQLAEMNEGESQVVLWEVHANGTAGNSYEFFAFGEQEDGYYVESQKVLITISGGTLTITLLNDTDFNVRNGTSFTFSVNLSCPDGGGDCDAGNLTLDPIVVEKLEELGVDVGEVERELGIGGVEEVGFLGRVLGFLDGLF